MTTTIELAGLELHGYHGVLEEERRDGQRFLFDVWVDLAAPPAGDRIADALDYRKLAACVREISDGTKFQLLESLAAAIADELMQRFPVTATRVRVRKPDVRLDPPVDYSGVSVTRP
jgi:dihydroneopterin aldolase